MKNPMKKTRKVQRFMKIVCNKRWGGGFFSNGYHCAQVPLKSFRPSVIEVVHWAKGYVKLNKQFIKKKKKKKRKKRCNKMGYSQEYLSFSPP